MNTATAALLRAVADVANHAQAAPTDSAGIRARRHAQGRAEAAWILAGSPDLPDTAPRPSTELLSRPPDNTGDRMLEELTVEVVDTSELALKLTDHTGRTFWAPRSVVFCDGERPEDVGDMADVKVPRWVLRDYPVPQKIPHHV